MILLRDFLVTLVGGFFIMLACILFATLVAWYR